MPGLVDCIELTFQHPACRRQWPSITGAERAEGGTELTSLGTAIIPLFKLAVQKGDEI